MSVGKRKLLSSRDLKKLYDITNPKLEEKPKLLMVIRPSGKDWTVESSHPLRGYRGCQTNLASRVRQYETKNIWPNQCDIGIGVFESEKLVKVLVATDRGFNQVEDPVPSLPLDDLLGAIGLTRGDIKEREEYVKTDYDKN